MLKRYLGKELKLTLPDNKKLTDINWLAIYDLSKNVSNSVTHFNSVENTIDNCFNLYRLHSVTFIFQKTLNHQLNK